MRLLASEHTEITKVLKKYYETEDYSLVKRRGWVYIEIGEKTFAFHRKKTLQLSQGIFEEKIQYFVRMEKDVQPADGFPEVIVKLTQWLKKLNQFGPYESNMG